MAPKKRADAHSNVPAALKAHGVTCPTEISDLLLHKLYKLADADLQEGPHVVTEDSDNEEPLGGPLHTYLAHEDAWVDQQFLTHALEVWEQSSSNPKKRKAKAGDKGKGKAKQQEECTPELCRDNPRCLNWLGQASWEAKNAFRAFKVRCGLGEDPSLELRDPTVPVGLKNLGATCYANSLLQVWYQDRTFRSGVYSCQLDPRIPPEKQPLFQLQVTFAALQAGAAYAFNPEALVTALKLNSGEQQDAQESVAFLFEYGRFAKLFLELLDKQFTNQPLPDLNNLVSRQFEGQIVYGTQCNRCRTSNERPATYRELELNLKNQKPLSHLIENMLASEDLSGDNKYRCDHCASLQNATRYTRLETLPPVLHFSLLRFGFDYSTMTRKKSQAFVKFPKSIDMGDYLGDLESEDYLTREERWFDLKGILLHRGTSAHSGHYTAQIYDEDHGKWFLFDDETVTEEDIEAKSVTTSNRMGTSTSNVHASTSTEAARTAVSTGTFYSNGGATKSQRLNGKSDSPIVLDDSGTEQELPDIADDVQTGSTRSSKRSTKRPDTYGRAGKRRKTIVSEDEDEGDIIPMVSSKDAYMLVYTQRSVGSSSVASTSAAHLPVPQIPALVQAKLAEIDAAQTASIRAYEEKEVACRAEFERLLHIKRSVYRVWNVTDEQDDFACLVRREGLEKWMLAEIEAPPKKSKSKDKESSKTEPMELTDSDDETPVKVTSQQERPLSKGKARLSARTSAGPIEDEAASQQTPRASRTPSSSRRSPIFMNMATDASRQPDGFHGRPSDSITNGDGRHSSQEGSDLGSLGGKPDSSSARSRPPSSKAQSETSRNGGNPVNHDSATDATPNGANGKVVSVTSIDNRPLLCDHDKLSFSERGPAEYKRISQAGIIALNEAGVDVQPLLQDDKALCRDCVWQPVARQSYHMQHQHTVKEFKARTHLKNHAKARWISKAWLADWMKDHPRMHDNATNSDPAPDAEDYYSHVFCEHGKLQPDEKLRQIINDKEAKVLREIFPSWSAPIVSELDVCKRCKEEFGRNSRGAAENRALAKQEKTNPSLTRAIEPSRLIEIYHSAKPGEVIYAVPKAWLRRWRTWLNHPTEEERPEEINIAGLAFCREHDDLIVDLNFEGDRNRFEFLSGDEWAILFQRYGAIENRALPATYTFERVWKTEWEICWSCRIKARNAVQTFFIRIDFIEHGDLGIDGLPKEAAIKEIIDIDALSDHGRQDSPTDPNLRRSSRARKTPYEAEKKGPKRRPPIKRLKVSRSDTLKDIKVQIADLTSIPILYQQVFFKNREIERSDETVDSIGITDSETLLVLELEPPDEEDVNLAMLVDVDPEKERVARSEKKKKKGRPEGFGGTGLFDPSNAAERTTHHVDAQAEQARPAAAWVAGVNRSSEPAVRSPSPPLYGIENGRLVPAERSISNKPDSPEQAATKLNGNSTIRDEVMAALPGACPDCTFQNDPHMTVCEVCERVL